jgi:hypothetical protein
VALLIATMVSVVSNCPSCDWKTPHMHAGLRGI